MGVRVAYDPQALVLVKAEEGDLTATLDDDFIVVGDAKSGVVGIKVVSGAGDAIVSTIATGYVHVYGSSRLGEEKQRLEPLEFDLSLYLKTETNGARVIT